MTKQWGPNLKSDLTKTKRRQAKQNRQKAKTETVVDASRVGWWRTHEHYDRDGYCDNPSRGY